MAKPGNLSRLNQMHGLQRQQADDDDAVGQLTGQVLFALVAKQGTFMHSNCCPRALKSLGYQQYLLAVWIFIGPVGTALAANPGGVASQGTSFGSSPNQVGEPSFFEKTNAAFSRSTSKMAKGVRSVFKKSQPEPTTTETFADSKKRRDPDPQLYVAFARMQEQNRNLENAVSQYEKALEKDPEYLDALIGLAKLEAQLGDNVRAEQLYREAIEAHPKAAAAHNGLGLCLASQGQTRDAIVAFERAVALEPAAKLYRNNIARELIRDGRRQDAFNQLRAVYQPDVALYNMGYIFHEQGDDASAVVHFQRAIQLNPKFKQAQEWLASLAPQYGTGQIAGRQDLPRQPQLSRQVIEPAPHVAETYAESDEFGSSSAPIYTARAQTSVERNGTPPNRGSANTIRKPRIQSSKEPDDQTEHESSRSATGTGPGDEANHQVESEGVADVIATDSLAAEESATVAEPQGDATSSWQLPNPKPEFSLRIRSTADSESELAESIPHNVPMAETIDAVDRSNPTVTAAPPRTTQTPGLAGDSSIQPQAQRSARKVGYRPPNRY